MASKIKSNLLFYLSSTREKSRSIVIGHDLNLRSELVIKLLLKNCRFKFDLLLVDGLRRDYLDYKFNNVFSLYDPTRPLNEKFERRISNLEKSICDVYPDSCLIVDSINLLILNYDAVQLNKFINYLLSKYYKIIILFNSNLIELDYLPKLQEIFSSYFEMSRKTIHCKEIQVNYIYKRKSLELGIDLTKGNYLFTYDTNTLIAKLIESKSQDDPQAIDDYSYDLSFKLKIQEDEERVQTVLPFMRAQNSAKVYYTPDKFDDVDEEDPDDDLLI